MRWIASALLCGLVALAGCATRPPTDALREPSGPSLGRRAVAAPPVAAAAAAPSAPEPMAPTPFTAEQIRDATTNGRRYTWRITTAGEPGVIKHVTFFDVAAEGAAVSYGHIRDDGHILTLSPTRFTWEALRQQGSFPAAVTTIREETIQVPAGEFTCLVYRVKPDNSSTRTFYFAKELPGPPILINVEKDGKRRRTSTLLSYQSLRTMTKASTNPN